jgi:DHA2 family multidrug resistance protein
MGPRGICTLIAMMVVGRLVNRVDSRWLILAGLLMIALSLWEMTGFTPDVSDWDVMRTGATQGFGLGLVFVPLSTASFATLAPRWRTDGAALISLGRNIGSAIGISFMAFMLSRNTQVMHASLAEHLTTFNEQASQGAVATLWSMSTLAGRAALNAEVTRQAQIVAYMNDFKLMMILSLVITPLVLLMRRPPRSAVGTPVAAAAD